MGVKNYNSVLVHPGYAKLTATQRVLVGYIAIRTWDPGRNPQGKEAGAWWGGFRELAAVIGMVEFGGDPTPGQRSTISDHLRAVAKAGVFTVARRGVANAPTIYRFDFSEVLSLPGQDPCDTACDTPDVTPEPVDNPLDPALGVQ